MNIVQTKLKFDGTLRTRQLTDGIVFHHSAGENGDVYTFHEQHKRDNGWIGVGYNYVILKDGTIQEGRPHRAVGAHAGPTANPHTFGICLIGNLSNHPPTEQQVTAARELYQYLVSVYGKLKVWGHRDFMATECPGKLFPLAQFKKWEGGASVTESDRVNTPIQQWEIDNINIAIQYGLMNPGHEPRELPTFSELAAMMVNMVNVFKKGGV